MTNARTVKALLFILWVTAVPAATTVSRADEFRDWQASDKVSAHPEQTAAPILGTQYTLSRNILKITAQLSNWIKATGGSVDGLVPWPELRIAGGHAFRTPDKIYLNLMDWPAASKVDLPRLNNPTQNVFLLGKPDVELSLKPEPSKWSVMLPTIQPEDAHAVIVIETVGTPHLPQKPERIGANDAGIFTLPAHKAVTHGEMLRYEPQPHKNTVGYWTKPGDWAQWHLDVKRAGSYAVHILQGCGPGQGGSEVGIHLLPAAKANSKPAPLPEPALRFVVQDTGHFQNFVSRELGNVVLQAAGHYTLEIRPERLAKNAVMDVREVRLVLEQEN